jgi:dihydroorotate dehydrogenase (fumarate)
MANLTTKYLGLQLKNPIIVGASELTNSVEKIIEIEKAGAGAVVLKSLFEEQILMDINSERMNNMSGSYDHIENHLGYYLKTHSVNKYIDLIKDAKKAVEIPVIASINCYDDNEWIDFAKMVQDAGADALEINLFVMPADISIDGAQMEQDYKNIITKLLTVVDIPVSLKLSSYFSGLANFMHEVSTLGINGLVLFNKFYTPKVDIENEKIVSGSYTTTSEENANTLRWLGILSGKVESDLSASTGIHTGEDVIANLLVGATTTQMVSSLLINGIDHISKVIAELETWMNKKGYATVEDFRGKLNQKNVENPMMLERSQFMKYFSDGER